MSTIKRRIQGATNKKAFPSKNAFIGRVFWRVTCGYKQLSASILSLVVCSVLSAHAQQVSQSPTEEAVRQHEIRLQQEQQRHSEELQRQRPPVDIFLQPEQQEQTDEEALAAGRCFDIHTITIEGARYISRDRLDTIGNAYRNRCLNLQDINELLKKITTLYYDKGLITSRAFVQPQNLREGQLAILVVEGKLESLESVDGNLSKHQLYGAFPVADQQLLNLRDLEQGLEQLNRLQQNRVEMDLEPGNQPGDTRVLIRNAQTGAWHGGMGVNNTGSEATGEWLASGYLSWDNPLSFNDNLYLSLSEALDSPDGASSRSYALSYSVPQGYFLYSFSSNYFEYAQRVRGTAVDFTTSGSSFNTDLGVDYTLIRGQRDKVVLTSSLMRKESKNYLEDVFLETSSRTLYLIDLGGTYTRFLSQGSLRTTFKWTRSEDWFDATTRLVTAETYYQFDKYSIDASVNVRLDVFGTPFYYGSNLHLFYSPKPIIASEALSIGGRYSVRGIEGESLFGYQGGYWRNELTYTHYFAHRGRLDIFAGLDAGFSDTPERDDRGTEHLVGSALGVKYILSGLSIDLTYAKALRVPDFLVGKQHGFYAALNFSF
jgi:hemolysin activation/secretion protein